MVQASFDAQFATLAPLLFYVIAFLIMYVENGIMLGFFLPGDSVLFSAGLVAASNKSINISLLCLVVFLGAFAGVSWVSGFTMLGSEVEDEVRGRTFAFVQSLIRISLVLVLALAPIIAAWIGRHTFKFKKLEVTYNGAAFTMLAAGILGTVVGIISYLQMRDRPSVSIWSDIAAALRGELGNMRGAEHRGIFIAFEGGEGSGKSTQVKLLKSYLESIGESVLLTHEPGETELGIKLRQILLAPETGDISVNMGQVELIEGEITASNNGKVWSGFNINVGNPHAVVFVESVADAGDLKSPPSVSPASEYPDGVNVEFVELLANGELKMRVHERGVGETRSCGTGTCAVALAATIKNNQKLPSKWIIHPPGGTLQVDIDGHSNATLTGPAVLIKDCELDPYL